MALMVSALAQVVVKGMHVKAFRPKPGLLTYRTVVLREEMTLASAAGKLGVNSSDLAGIVDETERTVHPEPLLSALRLGSFKVELYEGGEASPERMTEVALARIGREDEVLERLSARERGIELAKMLKESSVGSSGRMLLEEATDDLANDEDYRAEVIAVSTAWISDVRGRGRYLGEVIIRIYSDRFDRWLTTYNGERRVDFLWKVLDFISADTEDLHRTEAGLFGLLKLSAERVRDFLNGAPTPIEHEVWVEK